MQHTGTSTDARTHMHARTHTHTHTYHHFWCCKGCCTKTTDWCHWSEWGSVRDKTRTTETLLTLEVCNSQYIRIDNTAVLKN